MLIINRATCCYCGTCVPVCPEAALELIDACLTVNENCIQCGICEMTCPVGALVISQ